MDAALDAAWLPLVHVYPRELHARSITKWHNPPSFSLCCILGESTLPCSDPCREPGRPSLASHRNSSCPASRFSGTRHVGTHFRPATFSAWTTRGARKLCKLPSRSVSKALAPRPCLPHASLLAAVGRSSPVKFENLNVCVSDRGGQSPIGRDDASWTLPEIAIHRYSISPLQPTQGDRGTPRTGISWPGKWHRRGIAQRPMSWILKHFLGSMRECR